MGKISSPRKRSSQSCPMVLPSSVLNRGATSDACTALAPRGHTTRYVSRLSDPIMSPPVGGAEDSIVEHRRLARSLVAAADGATGAKVAEVSWLRGAGARARSPMSRINGRERHVTNRGGTCGDHGHHHGHRGGVVGAGAG